jgi:hypothetical protein
MDLVFIGFAFACVLLSGRRRCLFLWLILAEFIVSTAWIKLPIPDPWWFLSYAVQNCAFVAAVMFAKHRLSREYSGTLICAGLLSVGIFIETNMGGSYLWHAHTAVMSVICSYQLLLAASAAGLIEGTPMEAARGVFTRSDGRVRRPGYDNSPRDMGGKA